MRIRKNISTRERRKYNPIESNQSCQNDGIIEFDIDKCAQLCISNTEDIYQLYILLNNVYEPLYIDNSPVTIGYKNNTCLDIKLSGTYKIEWVNKKPTIEIFELCEFQDSDLICIKDKGEDSPTQKAFLYTTIKNKTVTTELYSIDGNTLNTDDYIITNCC